MKPILVAACGNLMAGDDAFGVLVAEELQRRSLEEVDVVILGMKPGALLDHLAGRRMLIVVDAAAVTGDDHPAAPVLIDADWFTPDRPKLVTEWALSTHGMGLGEQIGLARQLGMLPPVVRVIAVTVGAAEIGRSISTAVRAMVSVAGDRVARMTVNATP